MVITEKDRGQVLRMAGNIACGLVQDLTYQDIRMGKEGIAELATDLAIAILAKVDQKFPTEKKQ